MTIDTPHLDDQQLSTLIDDQLEPAARARAEEHLAACATCREALEGLRATVTLLRGLPELTPPRSFLISAPAHPSALLRFTPWARAAGALAAALFVVLVSADLFGLAGAPRQAAAPMLAPAATPAASQPSPFAAPAAAPREAAAPSKALAPAQSAAEQEARTAAPAAPAPQAQTSGAAPAARAADRATATGEPTTASAPPPLAARSAPTAAPSPTVTPRTASGEASPKGAPSPAGPRSATALRAWQLASGLLALILLAASLIMPRLARANRA